MSSVPSDSLPAAPSARLIVVLVRARNPSNIGAVARAMHDFGFAHLRVVNEYTVPLEAAQEAGKAAGKAAVHAAHLLEQATQHTTLAEAIADCTLVLGTTAVGERVLEHPLHSLHTAAALIRATLSNPEARVALLFGSEKTGLSNDELAHCHALLTIPMHAPPALPGEPARHLSMNLGQAAAVCLYALAQTLETARPLPRPPEEQPANAADLERLTTMLQEVFDRSGYTRKHPANARGNNTRRLVRRMGNTRDDAAVWSGILRQLLHALDKPHDSR